MNKLESFLLFLLIQTLKLLKPVGMSDKEYFNSIKQLSDISNPIIIGSFIFTSIITVVILANTCINQRQHPAIVNNYQLPTLFNNNSSAAPQNQQNAVPQEQQTTTHQHHK
jgi:hypothetical protein